MLPDEILIQICSELDTSTLLKTSEVSIQLSLLCSEIIKKRKEKAYLELLNKKLYTIRISNGSLKIKHVILSDSDNKVFNYLLELYKQRKSGLEKELDIYLKKIPLEKLTVGNIEMVLGRSNYIGYTKDIPITIGINFGEYEKLRESKIYIAYWIEDNTIIGEFRSLSVNDVDNYIAEEYNSYIINRFTDFIDEYLEDKNKVTGKEISTILDENKIILLEFIPVIL